MTDRGREPSNSANSTRSDNTDRRNDNSYPNSRTQYLSYSFERQLHEPSSQSIHNDENKGSDQQPSLKISPLRSNRDAETLSISQHNLTCDNLPHVKSGIFCPSTKEPCVNGTENSHGLYSKSQLFDPIWYHRRLAANLRGFWSFAVCQPPCEVLNELSQPETLVRDRSCRVFRNNPSLTQRVMIRSTRCPAAGRPGFLLTHYGTMTWLTCTAPPVTRRSPGALPLALVAV